MKVNVYGGHIMPPNVPSVNIQPRNRAAARPYHHGNLRAALVAAGLASLEAQPHEELRVRELARAVGVSANAAYRHFADRSALLAAIAAEGFRRFGAAASQAAGSNAGPIEAMRAEGRAYVEFARENPALFRLMFGAISRTATEELAAAAQATFDVLRAGVAAMLGVTGLDDRRVLVGAVYAWSVVHGLSNLLIDHQLDDLGDIDALIQDVFRLSLEVRQP